MKLKKFVKELVAVLIFDAVSLYLIWAVVMSIAMNASLKGVIK